MTTGEKMKLIIPQRIIIFILKGNSEDKRKRLYNRIKRNRESSAHEAIRRASKNDARLRTIDTHDRCYSCEETRENVRAIGHERLRGRCVSARGNQFNSSVSGGVPRLCHVRMECTTDSPSKLFPSSVSFALMRGLEALARRNENQLAERAREFGLLACVRE